MADEPGTAAPVAHPVACHCAGQGSDKTCPTRWNGMVGATNCDRTRPHRGHDWFGHHPFRFAVARMRCRGVGWLDYLTTAGTSLLRPKQGEHRG